MPDMHWDIPEQAFFRARHLGMKETLRRLRPNVKAFFE